MRAPLIVIGMHRSGTSMMSRMLHQSCYFMGERKTGNSEAVYFQQINRNIFTNNCVTWDKPTCEWEFQTMQLDRIDFLRSYLGLNPASWMSVFGNWGWKDPRNTFTLPFWLNLYPKAKVLHIYRHGVDVALSLNKRAKSMPEDHRDYSTRVQSLRQCFLLWEEYVVRAMSYNLGGQMLSLKYENIIRGDADDIGALEAFLGCPMRRVIAQNADPSRTGRFRKRDCEELHDVASNSHWFNKLGYTL
ncbi:MAG: hypothetical protein ACI9X0_000347 [Kiritimatiellia bacterium]|jgi:hypothetical protein